MRCLGAIFIAVVLLFGCAERGAKLPQLLAVSAESAPPECTDIFPSRGWQFIHSIEFSLDHGYGTTVVGVTSLEPRRIRCALVSLEGFTLFEAGFDRGTGLHVQRAVPPFDTPLFAEGLMEDIRAIFLSPAGAMQRGQSSEGKKICRFITAAGTVTDIIAADGGCPQIRSYSQDGRLRRLITGSGCQKSGPGRIPHYLELRSYGGSGYTLKMNLLRADRIS